MIRRDFQLILKRSSASRPSGEWSAAMAARFSWRGNVFPCGLALSQGDLLFVAIFGAA
jgi:hypothetical protein